MTTNLQKRVRLKEIWRPVVGFEGWYEVSNHGRVRRTKGGKGTKAGKLLTLICSNRYVAVNLCRNGIMLSKRVHEFVLDAFIGPRPSLMHEGNHDDGIRSNNCSWNLEWLTKSQNQQHKCHVLGLTVKSYRFISSNGNIVVFKGIRKFCRQNNLNAGNMIKVHNGERISHKGWRVA